MLTNIQYDAARELCLIEEITDYLATAYIKHMEEIEGNSYSTWTVDRDTLAYKQKEHMAKAINFLSEALDTIDAYKWYIEVSEYDLYHEHPMCTACGITNKRGHIFSNAKKEYESIKTHARKALK